MFSRNESFFGYVRSFPVTFCLILINVLVFIAMEVTGSSKDVHTLLAFGAFQHDLIVVSGDYYRMLFSSFLHVGFMHLLMNMFCLYVFCSDLEKILGKFRYLVFYLLCALGTSVFVLLFGDNVVAAGASGAIYGMFGMFLFLSVFRKDLVGSQMLSFILPFIAINFVFSIFTEGVSLLGHLGGFLSGILLAGFFSKK